MSQASDAPDFTSGLPPEVGGADEVEVDQFEDVETLPIEQREELLVDADGLLSGEDIDEASLSLEEEELEALVQEGARDLFQDPRLIAEISVDPVRLYLKEIGNIERLVPDQEFWLATRLETARRIASISRVHPLARRGDSPSQSIYRTLYDELIIAWKRLQERDQTQPIGRLSPIRRLHQRSLQSARHIQRSHRPRPGWRRRRPPHNRNTRLA